VRELRIIGLILALAGLAVLAARLWRGTTEGLTAGDGHAFGDDGIHFWAAPRLALEGRVAEVFDFVRYHAFIEEALGGSVHQYHFSYPPLGILLTLPLGLLPYVGALAMWTIGGLIAFGLAVRSAWPGRPAAFDVVLYTLALPAVLFNSLAGQSATWIAAALAGGLMLIDRRPVLAGVLLGLLAAKPHLGLLVPVALLFGGYRRALAAFLVAAVMFTLAGVLAFGIDIAAAYAQRANALRIRILEDGTGVWHIMTSAFVTVRHAPAPVWLAYGVQAIVTLGAALLVVLAWRAGGDARARFAVLVICALIATPYVHVYDHVLAGLVPLWLWHLHRSASWRLAMLALLSAPALSLATASLAGVATGWLLVLPALGIAFRAAVRTAAPA
jgi:hypothetical protein